MLVMAVSLLLVVMASSAFSNRGVQAGVTGDVAIHEGIAALAKHR
jgi:hypothetical protein